MEASRIKQIRRSLGWSQSRLAEELRLGANGARTVRRWESGSIPITGPASIALELMEAEHLGSQENT